MNEIGKSSGIDDEVVQDQRQRDDNDLQDERQDQPKEEEVEPRRCKRARTDKLFGPNFVSFMNQASAHDHNGHDYEELTRSGRVVCKFVRSGCTTALNVVPWETDGESVLREASGTRMTITIVTTPVNVIVENGGNDFWATLQLLISGEKEM
ncbi:hypothetical protein Tco_1400414 [Tanacetum coccineum]